LLLWASMTSCRPEAEVRLTSYYNVDSLLTAQIDLLTRNNYVPFKIAEVNQQQERDTLQADSASWAGELEAFRILDLNTPNLLNAYEITRSKTGFSYQLKSSEAQQGILKLTIEQFSNGDPVNVKADFEEKNNLYSSVREYTLHMDGKGFLQYYRIDGRQKVAFGDWVDYNVEGHVGSKP
jgi:hypothetical protein